jgi:hypothetical protein
MEPSEVRIHHTAHGVELIRSCRVFDLTSQLCNIPQYPTAYGGYSDVWKCDWIKDGTVLKVPRQLRFSI